MDLGSVPYLRWPQKKKICNTLTVAQWRFKLHLLSEVVYRFGSSIRSQRCLFYPSLPYMNCK